MSCHKKAPLAYHPSLPSCHPSLPSCHPERSEGDLWPPLARHGTREILSAAKDDIRAAHAQDDIRAAQDDMRAAQDDR